MVVVAAVVVAAVAAVRGGVRGGVVAHLDELEGLLSDLPAALAVGEGHHVAHELLRRDGGMHGVVAILQANRRVCE